MKAVRDGQSLVIIHGVLCELIGVLTRSYGYTKLQCLDVLERLLGFGALAAGVPFSEPPWHTRRLRAAGAGNRHQRVLNWEVSGWMGDSAGAEGRRHLRRGCSRSCRRG